MHVFKSTAVHCCELKKLIWEILLIAIAFLYPISLPAQVRPAARGGDAKLIAGGEYSYFKTDFPSTVHMQGITGFADYSFTPRIGVEGEARFLYFNSFHGEHETNYLIGPKVYIRPYGKLKPFGKLLIGRGAIQFPFSIGSGSYFAIAPGAGIDYRVQRNWYLRGEYEYQFWTSAPGIAGQTSNGMKPNGFSAGLAYRFF